MTRFFYTKIHMVLFYIQSFNADALMIISDIILAYWYICDERVFCGDIYDIFMS